jgi:hypothetical protein
MSFIMSVIVHYLEHEFINRPFKSNVLNASISNKEAEDEANKSTSNKQKCIHRDFHRFQEKIPN